MLIAHIRDPRSVAGKSPEVKSTIEFRREALPIQYAGKSRQRDMKLSGVAAVIFLRLKVAAPVVGG